MDQSIGKLKQSIVTAGYLQKIPIENGPNPDLVGTWFIDSIKAHRAFIFTHQEMMQIFDLRGAMIKDDYIA